MRLAIDARKSVSHPDAIKIESYEDSFEEIELNFMDVQYYKGISSLNIAKDPNVDIGSIDRMLVRELDGEDGRVSVVNQVIVPSTYTNVLELESDWILLEVGFNDFTIK